MFNKFAYILNKILFQVFQIGLYGCSICGTQFILKRQDTQGTSIVDDEAFQFAVAKGLVIHANRRGGRADL